MTASERIISEALTLPDVDRLEVIEQIGDSLAAVPESLELSEVQRRALDRRLEDMDANLRAGILWEDVKAELRKPR